MVALVYLCQPTRVEREPEELPVVNRFMKF